MRKYVLCLLIGGGFMMCLAYAPLIAVMFFEKIFPIAVYVWLGGVIVSFIIASYGLLKLIQHGHQMTDIRWLLRS